MLVENYSNSRSLQTHSAVEAIFSDLRVNMKKKKKTLPAALDLNLCTYERGAALLVNLPGWRWAAINKVALDRLSRSLHSDVCDSDGCCDAVVHSTISGSGNRRTRAVPNERKNTKLRGPRRITTKRRCPC